MSRSVEQENPNLHHNHNLKQQPPTRSQGRNLSLPDVLLRDQNAASLKHAVLKMQDRHIHRLSLSSMPSPSPLSEPGSIALDPPGPDYTSLLSDELLLNVFSKLPISQHVANSLVCKRWLCLHGRLVQSLKLKDWEFLDSGRLFFRFPNLTVIDIVDSCIRVSRNSGITVTNKSFSVRIDAQFSPDGFLGKGLLLRSSNIESGLELIAKNFTNLRRLAAIAPSEEGLLSIARECHTLQELELHCCGDLSLKGISGCRNLQVVKLVGRVDGFYLSVVSDIGLTILAQGCTRLVKLELWGCEGSYDGIKAIGQCCQMLEELTLYDHRMDGGWLAALSFCGNLKTLSFQSCKNIDLDPGSEEHLVACSTLEELHLQRCHLGDKAGLKALFLICENVRDMILKSCWGLKDDVFALAALCRRVKLLSLERCSLLTTGGLESVLLSWKEIERLSVNSCNKIKDSEITPELATLFSVLKELKWRPDCRSLLQSNLAGTGMGRKGGKFFNSLKG